MEANTSNSSIVEGNEDVDIFQRYPNSTAFDTIRSIPTHPSEWTLNNLSSITFQDLHEALQFFKAVALVIGSRLRKDRTYEKHGVIVMQEFLCNRTGKRTAQNMENENRVYRPRHLTRCGCKASFRVAINNDCMGYHISQFRNIHNHDLVPSPYGHILRSQRSIDINTAHQIAELRSAGIRPSQMMDLFVSSRGGYDQVGFTRVDLYNHIYRSSDCSHITNECDQALSLVQTMMRQDPGLFCRIYKDEEGRLNRLFFLDGISRSEYRAFGDVVICDSTYKTNHFRLPLVLLLGVDKHYSTIVFACALISDEEKETYLWVYENFVSCMDGVQPTVIVTDGDRAMRWAIREAMPTTRHRLCS